MDEGIRRAALRAALKTAIIVSLSGCYDMHERVPRVALTDAGRAPPDAAIAVAVDAPPPPPDVPPLGCSEHLESLAITNPSPPEDRWAWGAQFTDEAARVDPFTGACCMELEIAASMGTLDPSVSGPLAMACCDVIVTSQHLVPFSSLGCTPWGPPCPAEMSDEDELAGAGHRAVA